jgi:hypothetical protein
MAIQGDSSPTRYRAFLLALFICLVALGLHGYPLVRPAMFDDDFVIVAQSWTWSAARANLWQPHNEHVIPLGRLSTAALVELAGGRLTAMPFVTALQGPLAVVLGMVLVALFVTREMDHVFYGMVAMLFFGLSQKYNEAVFWYTASLTVLALDTTLLGLLAAQRWRRTSRRGHLVLCAVWCALAPCWFAGGVLAGPLCALYLISGSFRRSPEGSTAPASPGGERLNKWGSALVPLLGTIAFVAISMAFAASKVVHAEHHHGHSLLEVFSPVKGLVLTARTLVDNLIFGVYAATGHVASDGLLVVALVVLALVGWYWWRVATHRRLLVLGLGFIFLNYGLFFSFRAEGWSYEDMMVGWTRSNLLPFLGLVFFLCGGLPSRQGTLFTLDKAGDLTNRQFAGLALLTVLLAAVQVPMVVRGHEAKNPDPTAQVECLRLIEETDARCQEHHINAATARAALSGPLVIPQCDKPPLIDGWQLLRGSADPRPMSVDEARRLLTP